MFLFARCRPVLWYGTNNFFTTTTCLNSRFTSALFISKDTHRHHLLTKSISTKHRNCISTQMNSLLLLLIVVVVVLGNVEYAWCHTRGHFSLSSTSSSSSSQSPSGIINQLFFGRDNVSSQQNVKKQRHVHPIVLGFQNALSQSNHPFSVSTATHWQSSSRLTNFPIKPQNQNQHQQPPPKDENPSHVPDATRFSSVHPEESTDITATMLPFRRQTKRLKSLNQQQKTNSLDDEEFFRLDQGNGEYSTCFEEDDDMMTMPVQRRQCLIPSASVSKPAALQGKFKARSGSTKNNLQVRRRTLSSATAISTTSTSAQLTGTTAKYSSSDTRGGSSTAIATAAATVAVHRPLFFWENMVSGAVSRSVAQTIMHPANCMKTMLQNTNDVSFRQLCQPQMFRRLTVGAGANFILSIPHGAVNFAVLELVRGRLNAAMDTIPRLNRRKDALGPTLDFMSSCISTISCSIVSTPQMMITDVSNTQL
jgi:hypothetical protein